MRLLATSKGMFTQEEMVPDTRPMVNFLRNSSVGSWVNNKKHKGGVKERDGCDTTVAQNPAGQKQSPPVRCSKTAKCAQCSSKMTDSACAYDCKAGMKARIILW